jgi:hypothetical protein
VWAQFLEAPTAARVAMLDALSEEQLGDALLALPTEGRTAALAQLDRDMLARLLGKVPQRVLLALGRQGLASLGTYRARLTKRERVGGAMTAPQTLALTVRPHPAAFCLEFVKGPSAGRRVLYNAELRRDELRVKEAGALGFVGALWLHLDNVLTRRDTNHRATEVGFAALLDLIERDTAQASAAGGHGRRNEGFDEAGCFRAVFHAPPGVAGLIAVSTCIGFDPALSLPMSVEVHDRGGLLETYHYTQVEKAVAVDDRFFRPGGFL